MTGVVTDDKGTLMPGAKITVWHDYVDLSSVLADESGGYKVNFTGVPGLNRGPAGTEESVAFALVESTGYGRLARYLLGTTRDLVEDFHLHLIKRITGQNGDIVVRSLGSLPPRDLSQKGSHTVL